MIEMYGRKIDVEDEVKLFHSVGLLVPEDFLDAKYYVSVNIKGFEQAESLGHSVGEVVEAVSYLKERSTDHLAQMQISKMIITDSGTLKKLEDIMKVQAASISSLDKFIEALK
ncbi:MAG: hypothetical protein V2A62_04960 [Candidatus Woesearchaeota archaeon]